MSFILCRQEEVTHPLYIEALGVHIWSSQELCYVIYNYPLLAMDHFLDERLTEFIEKELRMTVLAARLENGLRTGADEDELIFMFLEECHFLQSERDYGFPAEDQLLPKYGLAGVCQGYGRLLLHAAPVRHSASGI